MLDTMADFPFGAVLGVSRAHTPVDEIQYLLAHSLLNQILKRWALLPSFLETLCSVKGSLIGAFPRLDFFVFLFYRA